MPGIITRLILLLGLGVAGCGATASASPPLRTVPRVDLQRYLGTWYEIAAYPQRFQRGCTATTATYSRRSDGGIDVLNRCRLGSPEGRLKLARGRARVADPASNARLKVSFFRPFWGDYFIIDLGTDYEYAVVGHPSRRYLWILGRTPRMDAEVYAGILRRLVGQGYDTRRLVKTVHGGGAPSPHSKDTRSKP